MYLEGQLIAGRGEEGEVGRYGRCETIMFRMAVWGQNGINLKEVKILQSESSLKVEIWKNNYYILSKN